MAVARSNHFLLEELTLQAVSLKVTQCWERKLPVWQHFETIKEFAIQTVSTAAVHTPR